MTFTEEQVVQFILQYFLPFVRIGAMLMVMPVVGSKIVSPRVRLVLSMLVTVIVVPLIPEIPSITGLSPMTLLYVAQEAALGVMVGFIFQVAFQVFILSGQFMAMKMGLGFASMNDPTNGVQTTVLSQFFLMIITLMFVATNGHLLLIELIVDSFTSLPPGAWVIDIQVFYSVASLATWMFSAALVLSLPVLTSLLFVNIAFGVMSRAAPQLNIFAVGFPFTLIVGLVLVWLGLTNISPAFEEIMAYSLQVTTELLRL
ncbi:MAG: flagellar biosynthetic protein FliR [Lentisphaeria bacterium]